MSRASLLLPLLLLALLVAAACGRGAARSTAAASADAGAAGGLAILVDGEALPPLEHERLRTETPLPSLLPAAAADPAGWKAIDAEADGGRALHEPRLAERAAGRDFLLHLDARGQVCLTVRRTPDPTLPAEVQALGAQPLNQLCGLRTLRLRTREPRFGDEGPVARPLPISVDGEPAAPLQPQPAAARAWDDLGARLAALAGGRAIARVRVTGAAGAPALELTGAELGAGRRLQVKVNRKGEWRVRAHGAGAERLADLRAVTAIEVTTSSPRRRRRPRRTPRR